MRDRLIVRLTEKGDQPHLIKWLQQPGVLQWFPLVDLREIEDAANIWMSDAYQQAALTAILDGEVCGMAVLYLQPFFKLCHQCLFAIIVDEHKRGLGVGTYLLKELEALARERFEIELLHLEVYEGNPAIRLYERAGFIKYGEHPRFIKEETRYLSKVLMQKKL